jgi:hypothetical protein
MRMGANRRAVQEQSLDVRKVTRNDQEQRLPVASIGPASETMINGVPIAEPLGEVPPRTPDACQVKDGFDELAIGQLGRSSGRMLHRVQRLGDAFPYFIRHAEANFVVVIHDQLQAEVGPIRPNPLDFVNTA